MTIYHLLSLAVLLLAVPVLVLPQRRGSLGRNEKILYLVLIFTLFFAVAYFRTHIGHDYLRYLEMFQLAREGESGDMVSADLGFTLLLKLLTGIGLSDHIIMGLLALCCLVPVAWFLGKYCPNLWLGAWLYLTMTFYYCSLNFIRQSMAVSVLLLGYPLLRKGKPWAVGAYMGVILAACVFHTTAILMIPLAILTLVPLNRYTGGALLVGDILLTLFIRPLLEVFSRRPDGEYYFLSYHIEKLYLVGLSPVFLIVPILVSVLLVVALPRMRERFGADADLSVKLTLFGACFWSFVTQFFILERFSMYGYIYLLLSIPMAVESLRPLPQSGKMTRALKQEQSSRQAIYLFVLVLVLIVTEVYNLFGMAEGFHGVFPYRTWL